MDSTAPRLPSRREVLVGGAVLALGGCLPADEPAASKPSPDVRLRRRVAGEVEALAARYAAVIARFPDSRAELSTLAAEHEEHARALRGTRTAPRPRSPAPAVPATLAEARAALAAAERAASRRRGRQAGRCEPELARLLASVAACEAAHAALLERGR
jgi:hypothetical protein